MLAWCVEQENMAPKGRPKKKVEVAEDKIAVNDVAADEVLKAKNTLKKGGGKEMQGSDVANGMNGSGEPEELQAESVSGTDAPTKDKMTSKRGRKPAKAKVTEESVEEEKMEESSDVKVDDKPKDLPAKRGRKAAKIENGDAKDKEEDNETKTVDDKPKDLPAKRGRKAAAKIENGDAEDKEEDDETNTVVQVKDLPRSRRNVKADVKSSNSEKEQNKLEPKETKAKAGKKAKAQVKEISVEKEVPVKLPGRKRKNAEKSDPEEDKPSEVNNKPQPRAQVEENSVEKEVPVRKRKNAEKSDPEEVEEEKPSEVDNKPQLRVALKRNRNLDEMARQQRENDAEDFEEPKIKNVKGPGKGKGKRAAKATSEDSQPTKKTKEETKSKGASKKEKIPDVTALDFTNESTTKEGKPWNLKIATWNVNGLRAWLEKNGISYLHHEKPDILCIQETKCSDDKLPPELLNIDGYHCHWLAGDKDGYSGVGLITKEKPMSVQYGIEIEEHDNEGRVITAEYDEFYLVTTYIPNSGRGLIRLDYRQKWDEDFRAYIKKLDAKKPVVLCGDLNVAHEEIDLANPKTNKKNAGFTKEEREGFSTLLSEGFVDTFRHLYPDKTGAYTFWTYMMNARAKNVGWRLDYFVISERFSDHLCDSVIRNDVMGSDHCPIALFLHV